MAERTIWRPNSISPEDWEKLSQDEQIKWWNEYQPKPGPTQHPLHLLKWYTRGIFTGPEFASRVWERLTEENIGEFLDGCPEECLLILQENSDRLPADDDDQGWQQLITIRGGCYSRWVTKEESEQALKKERQASREGLRVFRKVTKARR